MTTLGFLFFFFFFFLMQASYVALTRPNMDSLEHPTPGVIGTLFYPYCISMALGVLSYGNCAELLDAGNGTGNGRGTGTFFPGKSQCVLGGILGT